MSSNDVSNMVVDLWESVREHIQRKSVKMLLLLCWKFYWIMIILRMQLI